MNNSLKVLIAVKSRERRDALQALLDSIEHIDQIYQANDLQTSSDMAATHNPALILVDFNLFAAVSHNTGAIIMVLVEDRTEQALAYTSGAKQVFIEGTLVTQLVEAIETFKNAYISE